MFLKTFLARVIDNHDEHVFDLCLGVDCCVPTSHLGIRQRFNLTRSCVFIRSNKRRLGTTFWSTDKLYRLEWLQRFQKLDENWPSFSRFANPTPTLQSRCAMYGPCKLIILYFHLTVQVSKADDPNRFSSTLLHVHIHSTNENVPRFVPSGYVIQLPENTQPGRHVITVTAVDADEVSVDSISASSFFMGMV